MDENLVKAVLPRTISGKTGLSRKRSDYPDIGRIIWTEKAIYPDIIRIISTDGQFFRLKLELRRKSLLYDYMFKSRDL
ncbi:hypothetical protein ACIQW7_04250 [Peribacillus simplex]|uniref:hypothetical protein n=1 Tax=Peribacillus simplex TaxID=1478 RepID=UPI0038299B36